MPSARAVAVDRDGSADGSGNGDVAAGRKLPARRGRGSTAAGATGDVRAGDGNSGAIRGVRAASRRTLPLRRGGGDGGNGNGRSDGGRDAPARHADCRASPATVIGVGPEATISKGKRPRTVVGGESEGRPLGGGESESQWQWLKRAAQVAKFERCVAAAGGRN